MKKNNALKTTGAACLAVGLVSTWDVGMAQPFPAPPLSFSGEITPTYNLIDVYFLLAAGTSAPAYSKKIADFVPGGTTTSFNITLDSIYSYDGTTPYVGDHFAIIGLYDSINGGVSLGFDPTQAANILATSPAPDFNGPWTIGYGAGGAFNPNGVDEPVVAAALQSGTYNGGSLDDSSSGGLQIDPNASVEFWLPNQVNYYSQISTDPQNPSPFTLVDFSGASAGGGGFVVEDVPEPTTISFLAAGIGIFSFAWLRRRNVS